MDHQFNNFMINYNEYIKGLNGLFMEGYTEDMHYVRKYILYNVDLKDMSDEDEDQKYVFTKTEINRDSIDGPNWINRRYLLKKYNGK